MANIALTNNKVILKSGKASCSCCTPVDPCTPPIALLGYNSISQAMYESLRAGGNYVANAILNESSGGEDSCNLSTSDAGIITPGNCGFEIQVSQQQACSPGVYDDTAFINWSCNVWQEGGDYRLTYNGSALCPYNNFSMCYSIGYQIGWDADNGGNLPFFSVVGNITINTSAGSLGPFGIWSFPGMSSGSLDVTITP